MRALLDSSSVINLVNADAMDLVCRLNVEWWLPPLVVDESGPTCAGVLLDLRTKGLVHFLDDDTVNSERFLEFIEIYKLGAGETECMAIAADTEFFICCDDRRAREAAAALIGPERVFGTIRVLRWCVEGRLIECFQAKAILRSMRTRGGFLPDTPQDFFCRGEE